MEQSLYHVLLDGRKVGPYDRRTIVGMRIKKALASEDVLVGPGGSRLTVADLIRRTRDFQPLKTSVSIVQAQVSAALVAAGSGRFAIPKFQGEIEMRVQRDVLRIAGRFRKGFGWKEDRIKIPLEDVVHAEARGSLVELGLRGEGTAFQRITFEVFSGESALDFIGWFLEATPFPPAVATPAAVRAGHSMPVGLVVAVAGVVLTVLIVLAVLLLRRH